MCDLDVLSTLSREWIAVASNARRFTERDWSKTIRVPLATLDTLIAQYGKPQFIKVDVEGFEAAVLSGLSEAPRYLSFEFNTEFLDATIVCIRKNCFSPKAYFNMIMGQSMEFSLEQWVSGEEMVKFLDGSQLRHAERYGEIFVRETP